MFYAFLQEEAKMSIQKNFILLHPVDNYLPVTHNPRGAIAPRTGWTVSVNREARFSSIECQSPKT